MIQTVGTDEIVGDIEHQGLFGRTGVADLQHHFRYSRLRLRGKTQQHAKNQRCRGQDFPLHDLHS